MQKDLPCFFFVWPAINKMWCHFWWQYEILLIIVLNCNGKRFCQNEQEIVSIYLLLLQHLNFCSHNGLWYPYISASSCLDSHWCTLTPALHDSSWVSSLYPLATITVLLELVCIIIWFDNNFAKSVNEPYSKLHYYRKFTQSVLYILVNSRLMAFYISPLLWRAPYKMGYNIFQIIYVVSNFSPEHRTDCVNYILSDKAPNLVVLGGF